MIENGIVPSMGHTDAVRAELLESKTTHATHLYNGMRGLHHREAGVAGHALLSSHIQAEIIGDGIHIHPDMVNLTYKIKGAKGIVLISDAMRAKGLPDGESELGGQKVIVKTVNVAWKMALLQAAYLRWIKHSETSFNLLAAQLKRLFK